MTNTRTVILPDGHTDIETLINGVWAITKCTQGDKTMKLVPCTKPENLDEQYVGNTNTIKGHVFIGHYDTDGNYYEHDITADKWYKLIK